MKAQSIPLLGVWAPIVPFPRIQTNMVPRGGDLMLGSKTKVWSVLDRGRPVVCAFPSVSWLRASSDLGANLHSRPSRRPATGWLALTGIAPPTTAGDHCVSLAGHERTGITSSHIG